MAVKDARFLEQHDREQTWETQLIRGPEQYTTSHEALRCEYLKEELCSLCRRLLSAPEIRGGANQHHNLVASSCCTQKNKQYGHLQRCAKSLATILRSSFDRLALLSHPEWRQQDYSQPEQAFKSQLRLERTRHPLRPRLWRVSREHLSIDGDHGEDTDGPSNLEVHECFLSPAFRGCKNGAPGPSCGGQQCS